MNLAHYSEGWRLALSTATVLEGDGHPVLGNLRDIARAWRETGRGLLLPVRR